MTPAQTQTVADAQAALDGYVAALNTAFNAETAYDNSGTLLWLGFGRDQQLLGQLQQLPTTLPGPQLTRQQILVLLFGSGSDPAAGTQASYDAVKRLVACGLAQEEYSNTNGNGTLKESIALPRPNGGTDTLVLILVTPWIDDPYFQVVGIQQNQTPAQESVRTTAENQQYHNDVTVVRSSLIQIQGGILMSVTGPVAAVVALEHIANGTQNVINQYNGLAPQDTIVVQKITAALESRGYSAEKAKTAAVVIDATLNAAAMLGPGWSAERTGTQLELPDSVEFETPSDRGEYVNLASPNRTNHILHGDATGGGHLWPGAPGKTPFPPTWSAEQIMHSVSDVATDPTLGSVQQTGRAGSLFTKAGEPARFSVTGVRGGVTIKVIVEPAGEGIITGHPAQ